MIFTLGLEEGGLMEDPSFHVEHVRTIEASNLDDAKQKWAEKTNHINEYWDKKDKTYWGWRVVEV